MGLKDIPTSDSNAILFRYKQYCATKSNIGYSGLPSEHESSNFCQSPAPRRSTIHKFSLPHFPAIHLTRQSPFYESPGHIDSRDGIDLCPSSDPNPSRQHSRAHPLARWFAGRTPTCHTRPSEPGWCPVPRFPAIHLSRQSPFYGPPGHIRSRDGIDLCPSSAANPSRQDSRAHPLARWFAGRIPACTRDVYSGYWVQLLF